MDLKAYFTPTSLEEAKELLDKYSNAKLMAGGTDLVLDIRRERLSPDYLIDISKIGELKGISEDRDFLYIGSMVTFSEIRDNKLVANNFNALVECARNMGSPQIRNAATVGGNIANAGSAADIVPCIISLYGSLIIEGLGKSRQISCEDYFKNYSTEKLKENEILTKIVLPKKKEVSGFYKLGKRNSLAIARVSAAISIGFDNDIVKAVSLSLGAVGRYPFRVTELEKYAVGKSKDYLLSEEVLSLIENSVYESIKGRKTMPFKKEAVKGVYKEALRQAFLKK